MKNKNSSALYVIPRKYRLFLLKKTNQLMLYREIITVYSKIIQNTNTPCGQKAGPFNVKPCSMYSYHQAWIG